MAFQIQVCSLGSFIRVRESGLLDASRAKALIRQVATASHIHRVDGILLDLRKTKINEADTTDLLGVASEFTLYLSGFRGRVANVVPGDPDRAGIASRLRDIIRLQSPAYEVFTSFEDAIDWLLDVQPV